MEQNDKNILQRNEPEFTERISMGILEIKWVLVFLEKSGETEQHMHTHTYKIMHLNNS